MRGTEFGSGSLFSYVDLEARVPAKHPLRMMKALLDGVLAELDPDFDAMYAKEGRPSIPPERLIRSALLQALYSIRSERLFVEQLEYNLLFRWFVGLGVDERVWDHSTFSKNRTRLMKADISMEVFGEIARRAHRRGLMSNEHFSVDGTLIRAWASQKSIRRKDGSDDDNPDGPGRNAGRNFHGEQRSNDTHASRSDPEAKLARKSNAHPAQPSYTGHVMMEHRNGLLVDASLTHATGAAEREAALDMAIGLPTGSTLAADKGYDTRAFVDELRAIGITPHVAQHTKGRRSAIDGRTTRHAGYAISQRIRKRIEEAFGWAKEVGQLRQTKFRGLGRVRQHFLWVMSAYNLLRIGKLMAQAT